MQPAVVDSYLGQQAVIVPRHSVAGAQCTVKPDAGSARGAVCLYAACVWLQHTDDV